MGIIKILCIVIGVLITALTAFKNRNRSEKAFVSLLIANIIAAVVSVYATPIIIPRLVHLDAAAAKSLPTEIASNEVLTGLIASICVGIVSLLAYLLIYLVLYIVLKLLVNLIILKPDEDDDDEDEEESKGSAEKISAIVISAVSCIFTLFMMFSPIYSMVVSASADTYLLISSDFRNEDANEILAAVNGVVDKFASTDGLKAAGEKRSTLNSFIYDRLTTINCKGEKTNAHEAIYQICEIVHEAAPLAPADGEDFKATDENLATIADIEDKLFASPFLKTVLVELTHDVCTAWYNGDAYMQFEDPFRDTEYKSSSKLLYKQLKDADEEEIRELLDAAVLLLKEL